MNLNNTAPGSSAMNQYPYIAAIPVAASGINGMGSQLGAQGGSAAAANNGAMGVGGVNGVGAVAQMGAVAQKKKAGRVGRKRKSRLVSGPTDDPDLNARLLMKCTCRKKDPNRIPRPRNAFILFRQKHHQELLEEGGKIRTNPEVSKELGRRWRNLPPEEKAYWVKQAEEEKKRHAEKYPNYKYTPKRNSKKKCPHCLAKIQLKMLKNAKKHGAPTGPHGLLLTGKHNALAGAAGMLANGMPGGAPGAGNPGAAGAVPAQGMAPGISYNQYASQQPFAFALGGNQFYADLGQGAAQNPQQQAQQQFQRLQSPQQVSQGSPQQAATGAGAPMYYQQGMMGLQQVVLLPQQQAAVAAAASQQQQQLQQQNHHGNASQQLYKADDLYPGMGNGSGSHQGNQAQAQQAQQAQQSGAGQNTSQNSLSYSPGSASVSKSPSLTQNMQQSAVNDQAGYQGLFGQPQNAMRYSSGQQQQQATSPQSLQQMYMQLDSNGQQQQANQGNGQQQGNQGNGQDSQQQASQANGQAQNMGYLHGYDFQQLQQSASQQSQVPLPPINNISLPPLNMGQKGN